MNRAELVKRQLNSASPLQMAQALKDLDLYDKKEALQVIDEVYEKFANGDAMVENVVKPVIVTVADTALEKMYPSMRKKGLTAERVYVECESFRYDEEVVEFKEIDAYSEYKNARDEAEYDVSLATSHNISSEELKGMPRSKYRNTAMYGYRENRNIHYNPNNAIQKYKKEHYDGKNTALDEYTGGTLTRGTKSNTDHVIPLALVHAQLVNNYVLNSADVKKIANQQANFRETNEKLNKSKGDRYNEELEQCNQKMREDSRKAQEAINNSINTAVIDTFMGRGTVDTRLSVSETHAFEEEACKLIAAKEKELGHELSESDKEKMKGELFNKKVKKSDAKLDGECDMALRKKMATMNRKMNAKEQKRFKAEYKKKLKERRLVDLQKDKQTAAIKSAGSQAITQTGNMAFGNLILYILKPIYYEVKDSFKSGLKKGVNANSNIEAIKIRFSRVKSYIMEHAGTFFKGSFKDILKRFASSFVDAIIASITGPLHMALKVIKEGFKIFVKACKVIWSNDPNLTERQKGDAIVKLIGGGIAGLSSVALDYLLNQPPFKAILDLVKDFKTVFVTLVGGLLGAFFMYFLDKIDIFAVKSEKRRMAIEAIFAQRAKELEAATQAMDVTAIEVMNKQEMAYEQINTAIHQSLKEDNMEGLSQKVTEMAAFFRIELPYSSADEFAKAYDANDEIVLGTI